MLKSPYKIPYIITQGFGGNANTYYAEGGLLGHSGQDCYAPHLSEIIAVADSYCFAIANKDNKDLMRFRAVYTLWENAGVWYEISYGHLMDIYAKKGNLKVGDLIGLQGNTGDVASGGKKVTLKEKLGGSGKGSHLHFQMRLVKPSIVSEKGKKYLTDDKGKLKYQNTFWEVVNPLNGYAGCVNPAPFFVHTEIYPVLRYGMRGEAIKALQKLLKIEMDGIFGLGTEKALKAFQRKHKLVVDGICGMLTWTALGV